MNRELLENQWTSIRPALKEKWSNLTDEDIRQINGRLDQLITKLQQRYGYTREVAEEEVRNWTMDRGRTYTTPSYTSREDETWKARKTTDGSTLLKWLLGAGIPLLLLAAYLANQERTPTPTEEARARTEAPFTAASADDRTLSQNIRRSLIENESIPIDVKNNLRIEIANGIVTVRGVVPSAQERDIIIRIIEDTRGVRQVNNQLRVR